MQNNPSLYSPSPLVGAWSASTVLPNWVVERLGEKRLVFTLTTGRSGTGYLAAVLNTLPGVTATHEPEPKFSHWMRAVQKNPDVAWYFWGLKKLPAIARTEGFVYIETSHLFGKGFAEALFLLGIPFDLIVLMRDRRAVARSLYQLNTIPGRTADGLKFLVSPQDPVLVPLPGAQILDDYQLCFWYTLEMEARAAMYAREVMKRGGTVAAITFEQLVQPKGVLHLADVLSLPELDPESRKQFNRVQQQKVNDKAGMKGRPFTFTEEQLDALEQEVFQLTQFQEYEVNYAS